MYFSIKYYQAKFSLQYVGLSEKTEVCCAWAYT